MPLLPFDTVLDDQRDWSRRTFGPFNPARVEGLLVHIGKELDEVRADLAADRDGAALVELIDVMVLAVDAAFQLGFTPEAILGAYRQKITKNINRTWPDWRTVPAGQPIEHMRERDGAA